MCVVSMVMGQWWPPTNPHPDVVPITPTIPPFIPQVDPVPPPNALPNAIPWPMIQKDPELAAQMLEVLKRLEEIDKKLGLLDQCKVAEPEKKRIKAKLRRIAKKAKVR